MCIHQNIVGKMGTTAHWVCFNRKVTFELKELYLQVAYYLAESSVSGDVKRVQVVERRSIHDLQWSVGYGSDSGGGDTVGLLR